MRRKAGLSVQSRLRFSKIQKLFDVQVFKETAMRSFCVATIVLALVGFVCPVYAQTGTSSIHGVVTDPQGRVVSGATVTLTSIATNAVRTMKTTDAGLFSFDLIIPGGYRI